MKCDAISEKLNDVAMNGFAEEEYGSCQEEGFWAALIIQQAGNLDAFSDSLHGIILEDARGFVDYEVYDTEVDARGRWRDMVSK